MSARRTDRVFAPSRSPRAEMRGRDRIWLFAKIPPPAGRGSRDTRQDALVGKGAALAKFRSEDGEAEIGPQIVRHGKGKPRREQRILREGVWLLQGQAARRAETLHVPPHIASLGGKEIEGRGSSTPAPRKSVRAGRAASAISHPQPWPACRSARRPDRNKCWRNHTRNQAGPISSPRFGFLAILPCRRKTS